MPYGLAPNSPEPKKMGECAQCGYELREDYTYFEDRDGNKFCSQDCAVEFYKITEKEW